MNFIEKIRVAEAKLRLPGVARMLSFELPETPGACLSPFRDEVNPSFSWFIGDDGKERWKDFASGEHGDCVDLIAKASGLNLREAALSMIQWAGLSLSPSATCVNIRSLPRQVTPVKPPKLPTVPRDLRQASQDDLSRLIGGRGWGDSPKPSPWASREPPADVRDAPGAECLASSGSYGP